MPRLWSISNAFLRSDEAHPPAADEPDAVLLDAVPDELELEPLDPELPDDDPLEPLEPVPDELVAALWPLAAAWKASNVLDPLVAALILPCQPSPPQLS